MKQIKKMIAISSTNLKAIKRAMKHKCKECQFEDGFHSFECSQYKETEWKPQPKTEELLGGKIKWEKGEWEKEFDKLFEELMPAHILKDDVGYYAYLTIRSFIHNLLSQQQDRLIGEIEEMPKYDLSKSGIDGEFYLMKSQVIELIKKR